MPFGFCSMFEVNLLAATGLQELAVDADAAKTTVLEAAIIERLSARVPASASDADASAAAPAERSRRWWVLLLVGLLVAAAFWLYREGRLDTLRQNLAAWLGRPVAVAPSLAAPPIAISAVMGQFLEGLPADATLEYMDAGAGLLTYWILGADLHQTLTRLNAQVQGRRFADVITPAGDVAPNRWLGTVAFASADQVGALDPIEANYDRFFNRLQANVQSTGGTVVDMIPGTLTAGEYVIQGSLSELRAHLAGVAGVVEEAAPVHYHRLSLLRQAGSPDGDYLLRVIFNLTEEPNPSARSSSPGGTGA